MPARLLLVVLLVFAPFAGAKDKPAPLRVLFVGNSLTYTNDLPRMVSRLASLDGRSCETTMIAAEAVEGVWIPAGVNLRLAMQQDRVESAGGRWLPPGQGRERIWPH